MSANPQHHPAELQLLQRPIALLVWGICTPGVVGVVASIIQSMCDRWFNPPFTAARSDIFLNVLHREIEASWRWLLMGATPLLCGLLLGWMLWTGHAWRWLAWSSSKARHGGHA
jgi:hypothetical protein